MERVDRTAQRLVTLLPCHLCRGAERRQPLPAALDPRGATDLPVALSAARDQRRRLGWDRAALPPTPRMAWNRDRGRVQRRQHSARALPGGACPGLLLLPCRAVSGCALDAAEQRDALLHAGSDRVRLLPL